MKYKFITFEGVEGCGKSTQSKLLLEYLEQKKVKTILTREPGGTPVAEEIRNILITGAVNKLDGISEILLNFAARYDHVNKLIKPTLKGDGIVLCDRFFDSTVAYQGYGYGEDLKLIENIKENSIADFAPDITFLIDIDVQDTLKRVQNRKDNNRYEDMDLSFHKKVRDGFLQIAKKNKDRFRIIDGKQSIAEIHQEILGYLEI
jgi:dTMP kinase